MALIQITAYVRNEDDLAKWKALGNKTKWLHDRLNGKWDKGDTSARDALIATSTPDIKIVEEGRRAIGKFPDDTGHIIDEPTSEPMEEAA